LLCTAKHSTGKLTFGLSQYKEEQSQTVDSTFQIERKLEFAGMEIETNINIRSAVKAAAGKRDVGGLLQVQEGFESLQISISGRGEDYSFDSTAPDNKGTSRFEGMRDLHKVLARRTTTTVFDKDNQIYAIHNDQDILSMIPSELQILIKSQLDPEHVKRVANEELERLPSEPVSKGDSWQRTHSANFGPVQVMVFGAMTLQSRYTYEGTIEKDGRTLDKISSKMLSVDFSADEPLSLKLTLKGSDLKAVESDNIILFDRALGQVVESSTSLRIVGDIAFAEKDSNTDLPAKLDLKDDGNGSASLC
jgi:hypothetical protein